MTNEEMMQSYRQNLAFGIMAEVGLHEECSTDSEPYIVIFSPILPPIELHRMLNLLVERNGKKGSGYDFHLGGPMYPDGTPFGGYCGIVVDFESNPYSHAKYKNE